MVRTQLVLSITLGLVLGERSVRLSSAAATPTHGDIIDKVLAHLEQLESRGIFGREVFERLPEELVRNHRWQLRGDGLRARKDALVLLLDPNSTRLASDPRRARCAQAVAQVQRAYRTLVAEDAAAKRTRRQDAAVAEAAAKSKEAAARRSPLNSSSSSSSSGGVGDDAHDERRAEPHSSRWGGGSPHTTPAPRATIAARPGGGPLFAALARVYQLASVQKCLEFATIALCGALLRHRLDAAALTALLLKALVPAVIFVSLSSLSVRPELLQYVGCGALLVLLQLAAGHLAAFALVGSDPSRRVLRRTAAVQVSTMAPVLSVFAFIREFLGETRTGYAALVDLPSKAYLLVALPLLLPYFGDAAGRKSWADAGALGGPTLLERARAVAAEQLSDPFGMATLCGLAMALGGVGVEALGFVGAGIRVLASAQSAVLFLLIGMKFRLSGPRPLFVLALLFARHGIVALATAAFLRVAGVHDADARLAAVLSSQASSSIVGFGQLDTAAKERPQLGFDRGLAFEIVGLSLPFTIVLNTLAAVASEAYVDNLALVGLAMLGASALLYGVGRSHLDAL